MLYIVNMMNLMLSIGLTLLMFIPAISCCVNLNFVGALGCICIYIIFITIVTVQSLIFKKLLD